MYGLGNTLQDNQTPEYITRSARFPLFSIHLGNNRKPSLSVYLLCVLFVAGDTTNTSSKETFPFI